jgi:LysR family glycine cleavage system transcriptional activator
MKRGRLPLTALRSFEVAGRHLSFTRAAQELYISQAAVSRQVRELEHLLGQPLFLRQHREVTLTEGGKQLLQVLTRSFDDIGACLDQLGAQVASTVTISCEPSFATCWLAGRLNSFQALHPGIDLTLDSDPHLADFRQAQVDLAIRYSATATSWPGSQCRRLLDVQVIPVAAPALLERHRIHAPRDLAGVTFLHEENRSLWQAWLKHEGVSTVVDRGPIFADGGLVLQAVLGGQGVALMDLLFVTEQIKRGQLVHLFGATPLPYGAYWLVARQLAGLATPAAGFAQWLQDALVGEQTH